jgi:hypothetical protein
MSAALKVPKNTEASIVLKWKKFGTTNTLPKAGRLAKLNNRGRRALVRELTKNPMVTLKELQNSSVEMGEPSRRTTIYAALHQSGLYGRVAGRKPLLSKRHDSPLGVFPKAPKDSPTMRKKILWSECQASRLEETWHHPYGEAWWWQHHAVGCFSAAGTGRLVRIRGNMIGAKYRDRFLMKTCSRALRTSDWGEGSPSNRTTTQSIQPRQHRSGFGTSL